MEPSYGTIQACLRGCWHLSKAIMLAYEAEEQNGGIGGTHFLTSYKLADEAAGTRQEPSSWPVQVCRRARGAKRGYWGQPSWAILRARTGLQARLRSERGGYETFLMAHTDLSAIVGCVNMMNTSSEKCGVMRRRVTRIAKRLLRECKSSDRSLLGGSASGRKVKNGEREGRHTLIHEQR